MNVLFLGTGNSCRSIHSEASFNQLAPEGLQAMSAFHRLRHFIDTFLALPLNKMIKKGNHV